jgi:hypothetical protein
LPGLGDPIIATDVTNNGEWVLATTETYLLLINVCVEDVNGFVTPLGKRKPPPKKLALSPEDIARHSI